jgi:hypothetical protein
MPDADPVMAGHWFRAALLPATSALSFFAFVPTLCPPVTQPIYMSRSKAAGQGGNSLRASRYLRFVRTDPTDEAP